jgi:hypothetical protein
METINLLKANNQFLVIVACSNLLPTYGKKKACPSLTYKDFNCLGSLGGGGGGGVGRSLGTRHKMYLQRADAKNNAGNKQETQKECVKRGIYWWMYRLVLSYVLNLSFLFCSTRLFGLASLQFTKGRFLSLSKVIYMYLMFKRYDNKYKKVRNSKRLVDQARDLDNGLDPSTPPPQLRWLMYVHQWKEPHNQIGRELFFVFKCFFTMHCTYCIWGHYWTVMLQKKVSERSIGYVVFVHF